MFNNTKAFSGFSVDDQPNARRFHADTLGLDVIHEGAGRWVHLPDSATKAYARTQQGLCAGMDPASLRSRIPPATSWQCWRKRA